MPPVPASRRLAGTLVLPRAEVDPVRAILRRIALGVGILLVMALLVWLDRDGYRDVDGALTFLDAVYYATVSASTTGFGDIVPVSDSARTVNVLVVTPLRVAFLVVLVGTTLEVATRASRDRIRVARWRERLGDHAVVIGFGTMGQAAAARLVASGTGSEVVVVADDPETLATATAQGFVCVDGDGTRQETLLAALVDRARVVVVALPDDATAVLAALTARQLNPTARIVGSVREQENADLLHASGADAVMVTSEATGRQLALGLRSPAVAQLYQDLLAVGEGFDFVERNVSPAELGRPVTALEVLVVAVVRDGRLELGMRKGGVLAEGDRLVTLVPRPRDADGQGSNR